MKNLSWKFDDILNISILSLVLSIFWCPVLFLQDRDESYEDSIANLQEVSETGPGL
jgi:hypothetical protein